VIELDDGSEISFLTQETGVGGAHSAAVTQAWRAGGVMACFWDSNDASHPTSRTIENAHHSGDPQTAARVGDDCHFMSIQAEDHAAARRWPCVRVEEITVSGVESRSGEFFGDMHINGVRLDHDERNALACGTASGVSGRPGVRGDDGVWRGGCRSSAR